MREETLFLKNYDNPKRPDKVIPVFLFALIFTLRQIQIEKEFGDLNQFRGEQ